ncbi:alpha/beta-hydrolase [Daedaleopsis nitida]|nr:alpha/beta-hydrolase [Daedaleopsis nitida]
MAFHTAAITPTFPSYNDGKQLRLVAKCYTPKERTPHGLTLLLYHCTASHKEVWEPILERLFEMRDHALGPGMGLVREAWSFDMPNSGEGAIMNAGVLSDDAPVTILDWATGVKALVASGILDGHSLVAIGHSAGCCMTAYTTVTDHLSAVAYKAILLVEPSISKREVPQHLHEQRRIATAAVRDSKANRQCVWDSREQARAFLESRPPWKTWHPRMLDLFTRYGLTEKTVRNGNTATTKTVLCCSPAQESAQFAVDEYHHHAVDLLAKVNPSVPIHVILGEREDFIPAWMHESTMSAIKVASLQRLPNLGHLVGFILQPSIRTVCLTISFPSHT